MNRCRFSHPFVIPEGRWRPIRDRNKCGLEFLTIPDKRHGAFRDDAAPMLARFRDDESEAA
jgi:hypothetical protein